LTETLDPVAKQTSDTQAHVALVERTCAQGDLAFEVEVAKPDLDQAGE
jgi:hypothetical protein